jgi:hypothetical protein
MSTYVDTAYIAQALGFERSYVTDRVVKREDFPAPALVLSRKAVRWRLDHFERWARENPRHAGKFQPPPVAVELLPELPQAVSEAEIVAKSLDKPEGKTMNAHLVRITTDAWRRARRDGRPFTIERSHVRVMFEEQGGRCAVSSLPFSLHKTVRRAAAPFAPSIDRIDSQKGYEHGNVRLVCCAINMLMNVWGDEVYRRVEQNAKEVSC